MQINILSIQKQKENSTTQKTKGNALHCFRPDFILLTLKSLPWSKEIFTQAYNRYPFIRKYLMKLQIKPQQFKI